MQSLIAWVLFHSLLCAHVSVAVQHQMTRATWTQDKADQDNDVQLLDAVMYYRLTKASHQQCEVLRWIQWMIYAGVDKIHVYDTAFDKNVDESILSHVPGIEAFVRKGVVDVVPYPLPHMVDPPYQKPLLMDSTTRWPAKGWRVFLDADEFIFSKQDREKGFLRRYLENQRNSTGVIMLHNAIFGGQGIDLANPAKAKVQQYFFREPNDYTFREKHQKYIAHMGRVCTLDIHYAIPCHGFHTYRPGQPWGRDQMRFNHLWGSRVDEANSRESFVKDMSMLEPFNNATKGTECLQYQGSTTESV